ncbi:hypothetical protein [Nocardia cyriacigeorgica]|uniref:hypothetical protein n=1 Tax=Nocardia cyriacigeorgica TaxID=135487 RepID=UPI000CEB6E6E|nr:hypothetical protein [Nocardia cyriacigeorgica]AVH20110.1 hypothetical protein C5B73_00205 [Nocardia cyriacigeorgica]
MNARATTIAADLVYAVRYRVRNLCAELRYCRALRLALLVKADGADWRRVLHTLMATYDVSTVRVGEHWFLIGPQDPRTLDRLPEGNRWAWYVCGPSLSATVNPSLSWEETVPGFSPGTALDYCREWAEVAATTEQRSAA